MQLKPITAIIVLFLVVASLAVAGCTKEVPVEVKIGSTNQAEKYVSTAYPTSGRSQLVQGCVEYYRNEEYNVTWINDTTATTIGTLKGGEGYSYRIMTQKTTYTHFPTIDAASAYFDSLRPLYPVKSGVIGGVNYYAITGELPTVTKMVEDNHYKDNDFRKELTQQDALITQVAVTNFYPNKETNQA